MRLQLHALAYNLGNFLRTLATPEPIKDWSLTSLKEKLIKIGAKVVSHGRYVIFQMAEVAIPRQMFQENPGSTLLTVGVSPRRRAESLEYFFLAGEVQLHSASTRLAPHARALLNPAELFIDFPAQVVR